MAPNVLTIERNNLPLTLNQIKTMYDRSLKAIMVIFLALAASSAFAQKLTPEEMRQQEQQKKARLYQLLDSGVYYMNHGQYDVADKKFVYVLNNIRSVPSDLTFYFGKNSFLQGKYQQSMDWLDKYLQLKGMEGQFSQEAAELLRKGKSEIVKVKHQELQKTEAVLSNKYEIDCGPSGIVACPVCKGQHVITKKGSFGNEYKTCQYCSEHGTLTCEEYNKLIHGELKPRPR